MKLSTKGMGVCVLVEKERERDRINDDNLIEEFNGLLLLWAN